MPDFPLPRVSLSLSLVLSVAFAATGSACGDDDERAEEVVPTTTVGHVSGGPEAGDAPSSAACVRFCEKSLECARAAGRDVPEAARDCDVSCGPNGVHRTAPAALLACADRACGPAFTDCARQAVIADMQGRDIAAFPPICQGLCAKSAWCHERAQAPLDPGEDDCEAACAPGGPFSEVPAAEHVCVHQPCGVPFERCRAAHGAGAGAGAGPEPASP